MKFTKAAGGNVTREVEFTITFLWLWLTSGEMVESFGVAPDSFPVSTCRSSQD